MGENGHDGFDLLLHVTAQPQFYSNAKGGDTFFTTLLPSGGVQVSLFPTM